MSVSYNGSEIENILYGIEPRPLSYDLGPLSSWAIPNTTKDVVSFVDNDTIKLNGKGGHYETCYKAFTVDKDGEYKIKYDYDLSAINYYGNTAPQFMHFGMFYTRNVPPGGNMSTYADYSAGNCSGYEIVGTAQQYNSPGTGTVEFTCNLLANTFYYLWLPMMNLADGVLTYLKFDNIKCESMTETISSVKTTGVFNNQIVWGEKEPTEFTLWETDNIFRNNYTITLNDDLTHYDEYIVYGSALRGQAYVGTQNRYVVNPTGINQGGCFIAGEWDQAGSYSLANGTEMYLSGTSGYVASSYYFGMSTNFATTFISDIPNGRTLDVHPYKIVGIKEQ